MDFILISFAFFAGLQAFFAPCSIALIPAYVGYYVQDKNIQPTRKSQLLYGLRAGAIASLGIITVYAIFGIILTLLGNMIAPFISWIELTTGGVLLFMGVSVLLGYEFAIKPPIIIKSQSQGIRRFYLFGMAYAFGALGCTLPIFLLVMFQALAQRGVLGGLVNFIVYACAMAFLMIVFSLIAAVSKTAIHRFLTKYMNTIQKSAGLLVLFAGIYMIYIALRVITI